MPIPSRPPWPRELASRARRHAWLKAVGTTIWVWAFFVGYFHLLRHPAYPVATVPLTPVDAWIPFVPVAIVPYLSLWFYVGIAPGLQRTFRELLAYGAWAGLLCAAGLALFYRWPTRIPAFAFDAGGVPGFDLLQGIDSTGNACPSMHVAIAIFTAIWVDVLLRECRTPAWPRVVELDVVRGDRAVDGGHPAARRGRRARRRRARRGVRVAVARLAAARRCAVASGYHVARRNNPTGNRR